MRIVHWIMSVLLSVKNNYIILTYNKLSIIIIYIMGNFLVNFLLLKLEYSG